MLRLDKVIKPWKEAASLNDHINLYGFWNETAFLTKSGDVGMVLRVSGVDYEASTTTAGVCRQKVGSGAQSVWPRLPRLPISLQTEPAGDSVRTLRRPRRGSRHKQRREFFEAKGDRLYQVEIFYCIVLEGARSKTGIGAALARLVNDPAGAVGELKAQFSNGGMKTLLRTQIETRRCTARTTSTGIHPSAERLHAN